MLDSGCLGSPWWPRHWPGRATSPESRVHRAAQRSGCLLSGSLHHSDRPRQSFGAHLQGDTRVFGDAAKPVQICADAHARFLAQYRRDAFRENGPHVPTSHPGAILGGTSSPNSERHRGNQCRSGSSSMEEIRDTGCRIIRTCFIETIYWCLKGHDRPFRGTADLYGFHAAPFPQIDTEPFARAGRARAPIGLDVFVKGLLRPEAIETRRSLSALSVGEQHPSRVRVDAAILAFFRYDLRIVAEQRVHVQHAIGIEAGGEQTEAPFELVLHRDHHGGDVPVVTLLVGEGGAVARARDEAGGLVRERAGLRVGEGPAGARRGVDAIGIGAEFGARRSVLQVVGATVFDHPRAFQPRAFLKLVVGGGTQVVVAAPLPAMPGVVGAEAEKRLADGPELVVPIEFHAWNGAVIGKAVIEVDAGIVVSEQVWVSDTECLAYELPLVSFGIAALVQSDIACGVVQGVVEDHHRRGISFHRQTGRRDEGPFDHVLGVSVPTGLRCEEVVVVAQEHDRRVGRFAPAGQIDHEAVVDVDGVGAGARSFGRSPQEQQTEVLRQSTTCAWFYSRNYRSLTILDSSEERRVG